MNSLTFQGNFVTYIKKILPITTLAIAVTLIMGVILGRIVYPVQSELSVVVSTHMLQIVSDLENPQAMLKLFGVDEQKYQEVLRVLLTIGSMGILFIMIQGILVVWWSMVHWRYMVGQCKWQNQNFSFQGRLVDALKLYGLGILATFGVLLFVGVPFVLLGDLFTLFIVLVGVSLLVATWLASKVLVWFLGKLTVTSGNDESLTYKGSFRGLLLQFTWLAVGFLIIYTIAFFMLKDAGVNAKFDSSQIAKGLVIALLGIGLRIFGITILARFVVKNVFLEGYQFTYQITGKNIMRLFLFYLVVGLISIVYTQLIHLSATRIYLLFWLATYAILVLMLELYSGFYVTRHILNNIHYKNDSLV